jgi:uncharacterized protein (TIGR03083 family)
MTEWNFFDVASKDNLLRTVRRESDQMLELASAPAAWQAPTAAGHWEVRDIVGHLVDTTEGYFVGFDLARSGGEAPAPLGVKGMNEHVDRGALALRDVPQDELLARLDKDRAEMLAIIEGLGPGEWNDFIVPHKYMGPLPSCFYPVAQLVDYAVHSWDIRQGTGRPHALSGDSADLLVPFCWIVWQSTAECEGVEPTTIGVRITGESGGETKVSVSEAGLALEPGADLAGLPLVLEFDAASFVLTVMGRANAGTARGDAALAERFGSLFFRI